MTGPVRSAGPADSAASTAFTDSVDSVDPANGPFTGTRSLIRLAGRRDRIMLPVWLYVLIGSAASSAYSIKGLYPTEAARASLQSTSNAISGLVALYGPIASATIGGITTWKIGVAVSALASVMSILLVVRHTRAEEQSGRHELLGATAVGRLAPLTAALGLVTAANVIVGTLIGVCVGAFSGGFADGMLFGLCLGGCGLVFGAIAAVAAQLVEYSRTANAISLTLLGIFFLLRAVGDAASGGAAGAAGWITPLGWVEQAHAYAGDRWWVLALFPAAAAVLAWTAARLAADRDLDAGLLPARPGAAGAGAGLRGPLGLAWRTGRGGLLGWTAAFVLAGLSFGWLAPNVGALLTSTAQVETEIERMGGSSGIVDSYLATVSGIMALIASVYAVQGAARLRAEETGGRAEPLLAGPVGRIRWLASGLAVVLGGTGVLLAGYGAAAGLADGLRVHDVGGQVRTLTGSALAQWPAVGVVAGIAVLAYGLAPRLLPAAWGALVVFVLLGQFGPLFRLGQPVLDLSPFTHVPKLPGHEPAWTPLLWLILVAVLLIAVGLVGFRRRDVDTA